MMLMQPLMREELVRELVREKCIEPMQAASAMPRVVLGHKASNRSAGISWLHLASPTPEIALVTLHQTTSPGCYPEELALLSRSAVEKRRAEFALGRAAAHLALLAAGHTAADAVLQGDRREPAWPGGFAGSITHCGPWAVAAAAKAESLRSIGIDLEDADQVETAEIAEAICSNDVERNWVLRPKMSRRKLAMVFSAKEAVYKALYPLCGKFFDFQAVALEWLPERRVFRGTLLEELSAEFQAGYQLEIGCQQRGNYVFTHTAIWHGLSRE